MEKTRFLQKTIEEDVLIQFFDCLWEHVYVESYGHRAIDALGWPSTEIEIINLYNLPICKLKKIPSRSTSLFLIHSLITPCEGVRRNLLLFARKDIKTIDSRL